MGAQLPFHFAPLEKYSLEFFVVHSGVCEAFGICDQIVKNILQESSRFELVYLHGSKGVGKRHLAHGFKALLDAHSISSYIGVFDADGSLQRYHDSVLQGVSLEEFISSFQEMKAHGGLCIILGDSIPQKNDINPHLASRLFSGQMVSMSYPAEEELYPVFVSLLERYHLRLDEKKLRKIIEMVPGIPYYFEAVSCKIKQLIEERGRLTSSMVKEVIHSDQLRMKNDHE